METLEKQKKVAEAEQVKRIQAGEEPSAVDTSALEYSIIEEQGQFPKALSPEEEKVYSRLVSIEVNHIQWRYEALTYLSLLIAGIKKAQQQGEET